MDLAFWLEVTLFILLLVLSGFFSSSETAMFSLSSVQLEQMRRDRNPRIGLIERMLAEPRRLIVTKSVFQQRADVLTPKVIFILRFFSYLFFPILIIFSFLTRLLAKLAGGEGRNPFTLREEIVTMLQMPAVSGGDIQPVEQKMIRRMFNFSETRVHEVMRPLIEVIAVEKGVSCGEAREISAREAHVRLPVCDARVDRIVGMLHTLDLLATEPDRPITDFIRPAFYVPASKGIKDLMLEMRKEGTVVAVVVDEFGGAEGIITIEDIMEEVVEELEDEYDRKELPEQWLRRMGNNDYLVSARMELDELCEKLKIDLPRGRYATLAGLMLDKLHSVPARGTVLKEGNITLTIHRSSAQTVQEVRVRW